MYGLSGRHRLRGADSFHLNLCWNPVTVYVAPNTRVEPVYDGVLSVGESVVWVY